jgi:hypothetical protein
MASATGWPWKFPPSRNSSDSAKISGLLVEAFSSVSMTRRQ